MYSNWTPFTLQSPNGPLDNIDDFKIALLMARQISLELRGTWGGKRRGAGRPARGPRPSQPHKTRPYLHARHPVHVTVRVAADVTQLRTRRLYHAIRYATYAAALHARFRIVHLSIQRDHVHLIVEAADRMSLARGMQSFEISAAKHINRAVFERRGKRRRGTVFPDRYHARILNSPKSVRHAIRYVLNNWRHHGHDRAGVAKRWMVDPFSSGISFAGWRELENSLWMWKPPPGYDPLWVWRPKTWLLSRGWERAGAISVRDVPGEA
ncbi:MAG TPA: transposase [Kofleriaceae bacterium]|nr:transposase [Kofleriaceae bacterium]